MQVVDDRSAALVADVTTLVSRETADLALDGVEGSNAPEDVGGHGRALDLLIELAADVRPAEREADLLMTPGKRGVGAIAIDLQDACKALEMRLRSLSLAIGSVRQSSKAPSVRTDTVRKLRRQFRGEWQGLLSLQELWRRASLQQPAEYQERTSGGGGARSHTARDIDPDTRGSVRRRIQRRVAASGFRKRSRCHSWRPAKTGLRKVREPDGGDTDAARRWGARL